LPGGVSGGHVKRDSRRIALVYAGADNIGQSHFYERPLSDRPPDPLVKCELLFAYIHPQSPPCYSVGMKSKLPPKPDTIELHPDAWDRFTEFVKRIAKAGPQHRTKKESSRARPMRDQRPKR
jgi:hypothetical protein